MTTRRRFVGALAAAAAATSCSSEDRTGLANGTAKDTSPTTKAAPTAAPSGATGLAGGAVSAAMPGPAAGSRFRWSISDRDAAAEAALKNEAESADQASSLAELAAAPLPRPQEDRLAYPTVVDPASWVQLAADACARAGLDPVTTSRTLAVVAVSMHDAVESVVRLKMVDPQVAVVAAGAAAGVTLASLVPSCARRTERLRFVGSVQAAKSFVPSASVEAGEFRHQIAAADSVGMAVARRVIEAVDSDVSEHFAATATGTVGSWEPTPESFGPGLRPDAGKWHRWNLGDGKDIRGLSGAPEPGSSGLDAAAEQVERVVNDTIDAKVRIANFWGLGIGSLTPGGYWLSTVAGPAVLTWPAADQAALIAVCATAIADAMVEAWRLKFEVGLVRPITQIRSTGSSDWMPLLPTPAFPSYVSGHSSCSAAAAITLAALLPDRSEEFLNAAAEAGDSRVLGGIHFWFDNHDGFVVGRAAAAASLARFEQQPNGSVVDRATFVNAEAS